MVWSLLVTEKVIELLLMLAAGRTSYVWKLSVFYRKKKKGNVCMIIYHDGDKKLKYVYLM